MIKVKIFKNKAGSIFAFEIIDHGKDIVCSAVTALSFNAVNSIELFTDAKFKCDLEEDGGYLFFELEEPKNIPHDTELLLNSLALGLKSIEEEYKGSISISIEEVC
jgi:hypothetical protein